VPLIPHLIPPVSPLTIAPTAPGADTSQFSTFDVAIGGIGFRYASDTDKPVMWQTAPYSKQQIDQAAEAGEQTLSNWWLKSQASFHGGAGNLNLERVDLPPQYTHIRFDKSKNIDCWTPGVLQRLPDTTVVSPGVTTALRPLLVGSTNYAVYVDGVHVAQLFNADAHTATPLSGVTENALSVCTDGVRVYVAGVTGVWRVDPTAPTVAVKIATYPASSTDAVVDWQKARLLLGTAGAIYEVDPDPTTPPVALGSGQLRYQHPTPGWVWRCFSGSPAALLAAGDAGAGSDIVEFVLGTDGSTPVLTVAATAASTPNGERILALQQAMGSFLAVGTTRGVRVATLGDLYSNTRITLGPLTITDAASQYPVSALATRDRFIYWGGVAVDEPGLMRLDLGTQTDQAGRFGYATDLIAPTASAPTPVTAVCVLPNGKLLFSVPTVGLCLEGSGPGEVREAYLQTSRIRYDTTEPKLFKLGTVKGSLSDASVRVESVSREGTAELGTIGFTLAPSTDFDLPASPAEWLALKFTLIGAGAQITSYGVKALPGTRRQKMIQLPLAVMDHETDRNGHKYTDIGTARARAEALFELDAAGDTVLFQEFGVEGVRQTVVVIDHAQYMQTARPTNRSDFGGYLMVTLRTVS